MEGLKCQVYSAENMLSRTRRFAFLRKGFDGWGRWVYVEIAWERSA